MDDYQIATLILGAFYAVIEFGKWVYNKTQTQEQVRMLEAMHDIIEVRDSTGRPVVYRDSADVTQLQKETNMEIRSAIKDLGQLVQDTNKMLQQFLTAQMNK